jgi:RHS repeat-associated protein
MVEKKLPGKQWEFIVYNNQDKPVATGPALNPWGAGTWGWTITKYDVFGRVVYTGWKAAVVSSESRNSFQESLGVLWYEQATHSNTIDEVEVSYTNTTTPTDFKLLAVNYYDTYDHVFAPATIPSTVQAANVSHKLKGLLTGSWERILTTEEETSANVTHLFYDYKGRVIRNEMLNYMGGYTISENKLDFTGKILQSNVSHKINVNENANEVKTKDFFTYSDQGRLLTHTQQINELPIQLLAKNEYDELGQLNSKEVGGTDVTNFVGLQKVDYRYNSRGWLKNINNVDELQEIESNSTLPKDLFALQIKYNDPESTADGQVSGLFNGNISETSWRSSADNLKRSYGYLYDNLNRLHKAIYQKPGSVVPVTDMYNEEMDYDLNGNIQWLKRNGDLDDPYATFAIEIDNLTYAYDAQKKNQLIEVTDATTHPKGFTDEIDPNNSQDYLYDDNGNMVRDSNKHIQSIRYNHLNLPQQINFDNANKIEFLYDAKGIKVQKKVTNGTVETVTNYLNGFQYTNGLLSYFPHAEGYVNVTRCASCEKKFQNLYDYVFNYTDQLGNVRMSWALDKTTSLLKIVEENHYYPFGLKHTHYNIDHKHFEMQISTDGGVNTAGLPMTKMAQVSAGNGSIQVDNKYRFQGQERQDELGLNWDSFKYRNYDYAIGRFMNIDPLTEEYNTWSPYAFSGNRVIDSRELEGLEPQTIHFTKDDAAKNFGEYYNGASILENREYASAIYSQTITGKMPLGTTSLTTYSYNEANPGTFAESTPNGEIPSDAALVGNIHSHGGSTANDEDVYDDDHFSDTDIYNAIDMFDEIPGYSSYITTPEGSLLELDVENPGEIIKSTQLPSDPNDPGRLNTIAPVNKLEEGRQQLKKDVQTHLEYINPIH